TASTNRPRNPSNVRYHSRSQWVCETSTHRRSCRVATRESLTPTRSCKAIRGYCLRARDDHQRPISTLLPRRFLLLPDLVEAFPAHAVHISTAAGTPSH